MDIRRVVAGIGRTLIAAGVLVLLFVAYQLWGTGLAEARSQDALRKEFRTFLEVPSTTQRPTSTTTGTEIDTSTTTVEEPSTTTTELAGLPNVAKPGPGQPVAIIEIPRIDVRKVVVEGVSTGDLKKGPGHYPSTPLPGQPGNAAIAGHRTTYGAPFYRLDELQPDDRIEVTTRQGEFVYRVRGSRVVNPDQREVLDPTDSNILTLTTCNPRYSARQRLVVVAALTDEPAEATPPPTTTTVPSTDVPTTDAPTTIVPTTVELPAEPVDEPALEAGLSGDPSARAPAIGWGLLAALVWLVSWLASRRIGKVPAYAVGVPLFGVVLFLFFENFARLLPPNI